MNYEIFETYTGKVIETNLTYEELSNKMNFNNLLSEEQDIYRNGYCWRYIYEITQTTKISKEKLTVCIIKQYQERLGKSFTANKFKLIGTELRDRFGLTDMQTIDILNKKSDIILDILAELEKREEN